MLQNNMWLDEKILEMASLAKHSQKMQTSDVFQVYYDISYSSLYSYFPLQDVSGICVRAERHSNKISRKDLTVQVGDPHNVFTLEQLLLSASSSE